MESSANMVSRNRCFETQSILNSSKYGVSGPTGFNTNPKGQNRLWRVQQTWFHEIDVSKTKSVPNSSKIRVSGQTGFNTNPKGQNRPWRVQQTWFHEIDVSKTKTPLTRPK